MKKVIYLVLLLAVMACKKEDGNDKQLQMPPATYSGVNSMGCYANEKLMATVGQNPYEFSNGVYAYVHDKNEGQPDAYLEFTILGISESTNEEIELRLNLDDFKTGTYHLVYSPYNFYVDFPGIHSGCYQGQNTNYYCTDSRDSLVGLCTITKLDTVDHIISGTFYFDGGTYVDTTVMRVTEGRFDAKYRDYRGH